MFSRTNTKTAKHGVIAKNWAAEALRRRCKGKPLAVPIKISSIITNCCNGTDCTTGFCWHHKNNPLLCKCYPTPPNQDWEKHGSGHAPPTDMEMMTDIQMLAPPAPTSNLYNMCVTKCRTDQGRFFNKGGYNLPIYFACLDDCKADEARRQGSGLPPL